MILYNCKSIPPHYRITKFDDDMNPIGSYAVTMTTCDCPAGVRPTCRHRQMLPKFISENVINGEAFLDWDGTTLWHTWNDDGSIHLIGSKPLPSPAKMPEPSPVLQQAIDPSSPSSLRRRV